MEPIFRPLPHTPDHSELERGVLELWEREATFEAVREQNSGRPTFSFLDGPITANNAAGIHHGHGRTLKDVFQRYKAMRGFDQRYQNGFDCQGLWVEVEVEKSLGLKSKRDIEAYGLAEFAERCKERVAHFSEVLTEQSKRLGQWMDWDNDYYTFSDTNIEYIWRFLKTVHERDWLYQGHRSTQWCPRCGTSLAQHEQTGEDKYAELEHPSLYLRFPLRGRDGEALAIWTTTPWTLPANVAAAVKPDGEYVLREDGTWWLAERVGDGPVRERVRGEELVGLEYDGPFDHLPAQEGVAHRVIPWGEVAIDEGTGIVHIAPGCGAEDFELSRAHDLAVLMPIDESGRMLPAYGELAGLTTNEVEEPVMESLRERGLLLEAGRITHRYPICWRCATPLVFRVVDDWFISAEDLRQPLLDANATVEWTPPQYGKRMDDWLRNMGDWNISRKRYFGLPLPFYPCSCGHLNVIGSRAELEERATGGLDQLQELHRPWIDAVGVRCEACGEEARRVPEVGDAWLDAGIVAFSTLGWQNPEWKPGEYATGASEGLSGADLPDHAYWERWFPADWVSEMREQIRLWFYSLSFMAVTLEGRSPYQRVLTYEKVLDETGREMHKSWGNAIELNEALERMGADVARWLFCSQVPSQPLRFGYGMADDVKRRLLTLWHSVKFFVDYANVKGFHPAYADLEQPPTSERLLDGWLNARVARLVEDTELEYERYWTVGVTRAFDGFVEDLSNWYIRRSRRAFWDGDEAALRTLWYSLAQALRVVAPVMPFLAERLWRELVVDVCEEAPRSVFLAGWPDGVGVDEELLSEVEALRLVVELGRQARASSGLKLRQPLRRLVVQGAELPERYLEELRDELRVKEVEFGAVEATDVRLKPNLPVLGPKLGAALAGVRRALQDGRFEELEGGRVAVEGHELGPDEIFVETVGREGWAIASENGVTVAVETAVDAELELEGRAYDLIHELNGLRRDRGLELTDRVRVRLPESQREVLKRHGEWVAREVLATELTIGDGGEPEVEKA
ncbi:MAG: isoleucine--tRNA ligase [Gaiellaceae bacterium]